MELFVNIVLECFERLVAMRSRHINLEDLEKFAYAWAQHDHQATGRIKVKAILKLLEQLEQNVRAIGFDKLAGEDTIRLHELRLPERPGGKMSSWLVTRNKDDARPEHKYLYLEEGDELEETVNKAPDDGTLGFKEVLYGLCERKVGCMMPPNNEVVDEVRRLLGLQMPTVRHMFHSNEWVRRHAQRKGFFESLFE